MLAFNSSLVGVVGSGGVYRSSEGCYGFLVEYYGLFVELDGFLVDVVVFWLSFKVY